jgi:hypothetical protein
MKLNVKALDETNSKGITHKVYDDTGRLVEAMREIDLTEFLADQERANSLPVELKPREGYSFVSAKVRLPWNGPRGFKGYQTVTIAYSPEGKALTEAGKPMFVSEHASMLTHGYSKPKALPLVGAEGVINTNFGQFKVSMGGFGHYQIEKL